MTKQHLLSIIVFLFLINSCFSQEEKDEKPHRSTIPHISIGYSLHGGYLAGHRQLMRHLTTGHIIGHELNVNWKGAKLKAWHNLYNRPFFGFALTYFDMAHNKNLGTSISAMPYIKFPLIGISKESRLSLSYRHAVGIGYTSNQFDRVENFKNIAVSSRLNIAVNVGLELRYIPKAGYSFKTGINFSHFSNGAIKKPNLGLNIPTIQAGFEYPLKYRRDAILTDKILPVDSSIYIVAIINGGLKEIIPSGGNKYVIGSLTASGIREVSNKSRVGLGIDIFYDSSIRVWHNRFDTEATFGNTIRGGIHFMYEQVLGKLGLTFHKGIYVYDQFDKDGIFYHRLGVRYYFDNNIIIHGAIKTHFAKADFMEWGVGYKF